ncbi:hypothetical protein JI739_14110 [Ramlibacter sp. AW1]|uniref:M28 family peptidase n=1 Tax=Ramlibacter aurantiacus TaxID=2801330 RepID=A0A936ZQA0_9BURK|nr:hypothetical protein [Ramlibacter aurantiacus]MBL0421488.1 hypothetical protein [Ramlibacter aurantiacus]
MGMPSPFAVETLQADLARHAGFGVKVSASRGDAATAAWIEERLAALGFSIERHATPVPVFEPIDCRLQGEHAQAPVYAQAPYATTGPEGWSAPLVVVRTAADAPGARGAIAMIVLPHGRHASLASPPVAPLLQAVQAAGARAAVIVPTGPTDDVVAFNARLDAPAALPLAVLAPRLAAPFLAQATTGLAVRLLLHGRVQAGSTDTLCARLRRGPRWLCLSTPRTGWFTCASERGTGTAAFLALAAWAVRRFPEHSLFAMNTGAHEYHFAGAHAVLASAPPPADVAAWAHLGAGLAARDRLEFRGQSHPLPSADSNRFTMATPALHAAAEQAFAGLAGLELVRAPVGTASELGAVVERGYGRAFAVLGLPRVFHTPQDDLPAVDAALLAPVVQAHARLIEAALGMDAVTPQAALA